MVTASLFSKVLPPPIATSVKLRRRLPIVGAICVLSFGLSTFFPSHLRSSPVSSVLALPFAHLHRSKISVRQQSTNTFQAARMEAASGSTVPSIVVYCTVPNTEAGKKLAESIVKARLAACVNRVPGVESVYEWQGKIETDSEELLIIKTRESLLSDLTEHIKANHEYDVPEVISLPITGGNLQYLEWLKKSTKE